MKELGCIPKIIFSLLLLMGVSHESIGQNTTIKKPIHLSIGDGIRFIPLTSMLNDESYVLMDSICKICRASPSAKLHVDMAVESWPHHSKIPLPDQRMQTLRDFFTDCQSRKTFKMSSYFKYGHAEGIIEDLNKNVNPENYTLKFLLYY